MNIEFLKSLAHAAGSKELNKYAKKQAKIHTKQEKEELDNALIALENSERLLEMLDEVWFEYKSAFDLFGECQDKYIEAYDKYNEKYDIEFNRAISEGYSSVYLPAYLSMYNKYSFLLVDSLNYTF